MRKIDEFLQGKETVLISGHIRPDGDCAGSVLGMYNYIRKSFPLIKVEAILDPIPDVYSFLTSADQIRQVEEDSPVESCDLFISLDCGDADRLGNAKAWFRAAKETICVDHHISNQGFADTNVIKPHASSTCEVIFFMMEENAIDQVIAECLYTGIVTDSGVFQYSCTSAETMRVGGILMETGINYPWIVNRTFFMKSFEALRMGGLAALKAKRYLDDQVIASVILKEDMEYYGAGPADLEGIVSELRSINGIEMSIFLYETEAGTYKISMRSAEKVDVSAIAVLYGGGGHARAAGVSMDGKSPEEIIDLILAHAKEQLANE